MPVQVRVCGVLVVLDMACCVESSQSELEVHARENTQPGRLVTVTGYHSHHFRISRRVVLRYGLLSKNITRFDIDVAYKSLN